MSNINFDNPYLLLIALPLIVLFTVPFVLAVRKDNRSGHNIASQVMHVLLAIIIAFAAAGTSIVTVLTETHVYVVADVSHSANKNLDTIDNIIKNEIKLPRNSHVGLIVFGKEAEELGEFTDLKNVKSVKDYTVDDSETNIAEALDFAGRCFARSEHEEAIKRVVLITDGRQTDEVDSSAMRRAVDSLISNDIKVDAYFVDDMPTAGTPEVQISRAEFTASAFIDHKETVNVTIQSTVDTDALIYLYKNGVEQEIPDHSVKLTVGTTIATLPLDTSSSGMYDYEVRIMAEQDESEYNNVYSFTQTVSSDLKVLVVTNKWDDCSQLVEQYAKTAAVDVYENSSLELRDKSALYRKYADNDDVNIYCFQEDVQAGNNYGIEVGQVPFTIEDICKYDEIVLSNIDIRTIANYSNFIESVDIAVSTFGKSLLTFGNTYTQSIGTTDSELKTLSNMLPVRYGQSDDAPKLYTIILDSSRSMFMGSETRKIELAKAYVEKLLGTLNYGDRLLVVNFFGEAEIDYNDRYTDSAAVMSKIKDIPVKQGTVLSGALNAAYGVMRSLTSYSDKQVMIITDGKNSSGDYDVAKEIVSNMYDEDIVTSVINFWRGSETTLDGDNAQQFARAIADLGHGQYFPVDADVSKPPTDVTFGEIADVMGDKIVDGIETKVTVVRSTDELLTPFKDMINSIPSVYGYYVGAAKASATSVMQIRHKKSETKESDLPLYAYWNYGNGRVASFASDISGDWVRYWKSTNVKDDQSLYSAFMDSALYVNIPNEKADYPYTLGVIRNGSTTQVLVTPHQKNLSFEATATVQLILPSGEIVNDTMVLDKDHYYYDFKSSEVGRYQVQVTYWNNGKHTATSVFSVSYTSEYDEFVTFEASPLFRALNGRGQVIVSQVEGNSLKLEELVLENQEHEMGTYTNDLTIPLLIVAVVLFVVDIIVRKLKWEDIVSFFGGYKKSGGKKS